MPTVIDRPQIDLHRCRPRPPPHGCRGAVLLLLDLSAPATSLGGGSPPRAGRRCASPARAGRPRSPCLCAGPPTAHSSPLCLILHDLVVPTTPGRRSADAPARDERLRRPAEGAGGSPGRHPVRFAGGAACYFTPHFQSSKCANAKYPTLRSKFFLSKINPHPSNPGLCDTLWLRLSART